MDKEKELDVVVEDEMTADEVLAAYAMAMGMDEFTPKSMHDELLNIAGVKFGMPEDERDAALAGCLKPAEAMSIEDDIVEDESEAVDLNSELEEMRNRLSAYEKADEKEVMNMLSAFLPNAKKSALGMFNATSKEHGSSAAKVMIAELLKSSESANSRVEKLSAGVNTRSVDRPAAPGTKSEAGKEMGRRMARNIAKQAAK